MHASFHERVWDLQQRKAGAERLKARVNIQRWFDKMNLNSYYGKLDYSPPMPRVEQTFELIHKRRCEQKLEIERLQREFRPF